MNSFANYLSYLPKKVMAVVSALSVVLLVVASVSAAFGPDRPTIAWLGEGTSGFDQVTFNSFTGVPNFGDERDFLRGKLNETTNNYTDPVSGLKDGDEVKVLVYIHNGAKSSLNASGVGVAENLRVRIQLPNGTSASQDLNSFISATNASPQQIFDSLTLNGTDAFSVEYVPGSAMIRTASLNDVSISDAVVTDGVLIGDDALDGKMNGCFEYLAYVTIVVKIHIEEPEPQPILECKTLTALPATIKPKQEVTFTATANADNGATISKYVFAFGDNQTTTVTTNAESAQTKHSYDKAGEYTATVKVNGTETSDKCKLTVKVTEEPKDISVCRDGKVITIKENERRSTDTNAPCPTTPGKELPNTGIGSALAGFFGTSALFASARTWLSSRRQLRAGALKQSN